MRFRFPWATEARRFSVMDLAGGVDTKALPFVPFGIHSPTTAYLYRDIVYGYESLPLHEFL